MNRSLSRKRGSGFWWCALAALAAQAGLATAQSYPVKPVRVTYGIDVL